MYELGADKQEHVFYSEYSRPVIPAQHPERTGRVSLPPPSRWARTQQLDPFLRKWEMGTRSQELGVS